MFKHSVTEGKEPNPPGGKESFNVSFSPAVMVLIIARSSWKLDGVVDPCIIAAMNGASSGSSVGYFSVIDILGVVDWRIRLSSIENEGLGAWCQSVLPPFFYTQSSQVSGAFRPG